MSEPLPQPAEDNGATIAGNTIDSSASAEIPEDEGDTGVPMPTPTPYTPSQDKGKQAVMPIPGVANTTITTVPGADAKALHTIPGAGSKALHTVPGGAPSASPTRVQRANYAEPADWSRPAQSQPSAPATSSIEPAPMPMPGPAAAVAATASQISGQQHQRSHPPPPSNAAHLPKTTPQKKGPYYIPQSAPAAGTGSLDTGVASTTSATTASSIPVATNQTSTATTTAPAAAVQPGVLQGGRHVNMVDGCGQGQTQGQGGEMSMPMPGPAAAVAAAQRYPANTAYSSPPEGAGARLRGNLEDAGLNEDGTERQWWVQAWDATKELGRKVGNGLAKLDEDFWRWQNSRT
ncbi:hypothetical protein AAP_04410 [Ascosphaera apis ARSEF 7405]|uniref:Uncharacterized protein n=1 Tax=Ascosphaera apis ARSEF 7405 TaxID=392613 RepID=A0A162I6I0_9EURO|nr:hypothetical protein AAP_04410 [Ascosphaera apis ARSEF 7405]